MNELFDDLVWRGLVHQVTDPALGDLLSEEPVTVYAGFDPTADSLHIGHLLGILSLMRFQRAGHRPIALAGGGTGGIGDPSGRSDERGLITVDELEANLKGVRLQLERFLDFDAGAQLLDNGEWLWKLGMLEFLRDVGKHITVNTMISKESVRARLEDRDQGISYAEFSYMLLQGYDFVHLYDAEGCTLQIGGSDNWGAITVGIDLIRRMRAGVAYGLTWPLVTTATGEKMGKTAGNAVWLDAARTSPYQLYQHFIRTDDAMVGHHVRAYTFLTRERIEELDVLTTEQPEKREAQRALAFEVTALVHGRDEATKAERASAILFTEEIASLDEATLLDVFADAPSSTASSAELANGLSLIDAMVRTKLADSKSSARNTIQGGGAYVNNRRVQDIDAKLTTADTIAGRYIVLRKGKKEQHLVRIF